MEAVRRSKTTTACALPCESEEHGPRARSPARLLPLPLPHSLYHITARPWVLRLAAAVVGRCTYAGWLLWLKSMQSEPAMPSEVDLPCFYSHYYYYYDHYNYMYKYNAAVSPANSTAAAAAVAPRGVPCSLLPLLLHRPSLSTQCRVGRYH